MEQLDYHLLYRQFVRPPAAVYFCSADLSGLAEEWRGRGPSPGQDGDTRVPVLINFSASSAVF